MKKVDPEEMAIRRAAKAYDRAHDRLNAARVDLDAAIAAKKAATGDRC